jgi:triphosphatase
MVKKAFMTSSSGSAVDGPSAPRGVRLVGGLDAGATAGNVGPVKGCAPALDPEISLDDALASIICAALDHFVANCPALRIGADAECVHQMRVALRRLRACLSFARRRFPGAPALEAGAARARALANALGEARDWDVFCENLDQGPRQRLAHEPSFYALLDAMELRRAAAYDNARALIAAPATRQFALDLRQAAARHAWREQAPADAPSSDAPGSAKAFATRTLERLHRRAVKKCEDLAALPPEGRHAARISLKKARYAAEFFQSLFDERAAAKKYLRTIAKIQDSLGADNDLAIGARLIRRAAGDDPKTAFAAGFLRGWQEQAGEAQRRRNRKNERLARRLEPFWR